MRTKREVLAFLESRKILEDRVGEIARAIGYDRTNHSYTPTIEGIEWPKGVVESDSVIEVEWESSSCAGVCCGHDISWESFPVRLLWETERGVQAFALARKIERGCDPRSGAVLCRCDECKVVESAVPGLRHKRNAMVCAGRWVEIQP